MAGSSVQYHFLRYGFGRLLVQESLGHCNNYLRKSGKQKYGKYQLGTLATDREGGCRTLEWLKSRPKPPARSQSEAVQTDIKCGNVKAIGDEESVTQRTRLEFLQGLSPRLWAQNYTSSCSGHLVPEAAVWDGHAMQTLSKGHGEPYRKEVTRLKNWKRMSNMIGADVRRW